MKRILLILLGIHTGSVSAAVDLAKAKLVDLTHSFDKQTLYWPTSPAAFELKELHRGPTPGGWFYSANSFCSPEHGGTHLDAPFHFAKDGAKLDGLPLEKLVGEAVVIDVSSQAKRDPDYRLTEVDIVAWEKAHGPIPHGAIVLLHTGWDKRWPNRKKYFGDDTPTDASKLHFPSFGKEAVTLLIGARKVKAIGVDTASIDYGPSKDFIVHQITAKAGVPGLENLTNLSELPPRGAWVVALPMKIAGASGGPLRAIALF